MTIKQTQHLLAYLGYSVTPDGIFGPHSQSAVTQFQQDYGGLAIDGIPGSATQSALRQAVVENWEQQDVSPAVSDNFWEEIEFFSPREFICHCGCGTGDPEESLVRKVDEVRRRLGVPITVSSGVRCAAHNAKVGGVSNSRHLDHTAADLISSAGPRRMRQVAEEVFGNTGGIGLYSWGIHVDTRATKARWNG